MPRLLEEVPNGCLDSAMRWALIELGLEVGAIGPAAFAFALSAGAVSANAAASNAAWDCGCADSSKAMDVWSDYKTYIRRAMALHDMASGVR